ncbi:MAG: hypothetical protein AAF664_01550 [Planctomycetota bacterium]
MKRFIARVLTFLACTAVVVGMSSFIPNPMLVERNLLGALPDKIQRLTESSSPKMVLIGGSNVSFGMNSELLANHFRQPVHNTALHAGLGLKFMLETCTGKIAEGDTVVVMPEYSQFQEGYEGSRELVAALCDVYPEGRKTLDLKQSLHLFPDFCSYSATKLCQRLRLVQKTSVSRVYTRDSFNQYGDAVLHWDLPQTAFSDFPPKAPNPKLNEEAFIGLREFKEHVDSCGAKFVLLPPSLKAVSFENQKSLIDAITKRLAEQNTEFDAECKRYRMSDLLFFNTPYHLNGSGVEQRTVKVIEDLDRILTVMPETSG